MWPIEKRGSREKLLVTRKVTRHHKNTGEAGVYEASTALISRVSCSWLGAAVEGRMDSRDQPLLAAWS